MGRHSLHSRRSGIPRHWWLWALMIVLVLTATGFVLGYNRGLSDGLADAGSVGDMRDKLVSVQQKSDYLEQQLTNRLLAAEIDWKSVEQVRQMVGGLEERLALQKEELDLYRLLLNRDSNVRGLHIEHWKVTPADVTGFYNYQLVIRQNIDLKTILKIDLELRVSGTQEGLPLVFSLADLDPEVDKATQRLSFRYFKFLQGQLKIPQGFTPQEVEVLVRKVGSSQYNEQRSLEWSVESQG